MKLAADPAVPGFATPANVMAYPYFLTTGKHVPDDVIYQLVKTLHPAKETLAGGFSQFKGFDQKAMNPPNDVPTAPATRLKPPAPTYRTPIPSATTPRASISRKRSGMPPPRSIG